ncbi:MAG: hypothetical protein NTZ37_00820 [Methanoregula sp.]|nr:hypothetical protein [Methanoregula sp.]
MTTGVEKQFSDELTSFFVLILLNIAFGALVMAFGLQFIIMSALAVTGGQTSDVLQVIRGAVGVAGVVLGFSWLYSSTKIMRGLKGIRREYRNRAAPVSDETVIGWIVEMMAHYRENRSTIRWMTLICSFGGCIYLALGIVNIVQGISAGASPGGMVMLGLFFFAAGINLTIGIVTLLLSTWFRRYSASWDCRLAEVSQAEDSLRSAMDQR